MNIEQMRKRKKELGYTNEQISDLSGVPLPTVNKIFSGATKSPRYQTMLALERVLVGEGTAVGSKVAEEAFEYYVSSRSNDEVRNERKNAERQGEYTLDDYYAMPDDWRGELIDGCIYDLAMPSPGHQTISLMIGMSLMEYVDSNGGECVPFGLPVDVQLDCDDKTMVEPDITVICDKDKIKKKNIYGAPDLVMEILSPSTRVRDLTLKLNKYMQAGVREYWTIDAEKERVLVYKADGEDIIGYYTFEDMVPVGIWDGECSIDFPKIKSRLDEMGLREG